MSFDRLLVHDVTILTAGTVVDRYGNTEDDWSAPTSEPVKAWLSQQSRTENLDGRDAQVQVWVAFLSPDVSVSGHDRLVWSGITFEVDGPPLPAWTPRGLHHYEATLRVVEG